MCVLLFMVNVEVRLVISFDLSCALGYSVSASTAAVAVSGCRINVCQQQETATMQEQFSEACLRDSLYFLSQFQWVNNK